MRSRWYAGAGESSGSAPCGSATSRWRTPRRGHRDRQRPRAADPRASREASRGPTARRPAPSEVPERWWSSAAASVGVEMAQACRGARRAGHADRGGVRLLAREEPFAGERGARRRCGRPASTSAPAPTATAGRAERDGRGDRRARDGASVRATRSSSPPAARPSDRPRRSTTVGVEPGRPIEVDDRLRVPGRTGSTPSATSTAAPAHPHGQVPGAARRRRILGRPSPLRQRRRPLSARDLHRPAGRRGRPHAGQRAGGRHRRARRDVPTGGTPEAPSSAAARPGTARIVVDEDRRVIVGATSRAPTSPRPPRGDDRRRRRGPARRPWHAVPASPRAARSG